MRRAETILVLFATLALPVDGFAADQAEAVAEVERAPVRGDGLVVVRDADSGELRTATVEERNALFGAAARQRVAPTPSLPTASGTTPSGIRWAIPGPAAMSFSVVERGGDGKLRSRCVSAPTGEEALEISTAEGRHDR